MTTATDISWSGQQAAALDAVARWRHDHNAQVFRLFGYAGSGKSTLARHLGGDGQVLYAAFTGKAAHVMRSKGCSGASTIHSLIYAPRDGGGTIAAIKKELQDAIDQCEAEDCDPEKNSDVRRLRNELEQAKQKAKRPYFDLRMESPISAADLLIIDECSMVDGRMAEDLMSFKTKILVLGDPAQLPPVRGEGYFTDAKPDVLLTEIHRQARDNPIIDLATRVREGQELRVGTYGDTRIVRPGDCTKEDYTSHDQIIVGKNKTRRAVNHEVRRLLGKPAEPIPVPGDRLVCLRNNKELGLLNGSLWDVAQASRATEGRIALDVDPADGTGVPLSCVAHDHYFRGEEPEFYEMKEAEHFDFGYALTCHKSQGSQFDSVLVVDEADAFREHARRWRYTALTRAAQRVTWVIR